MHFQPGDIRGEIRKRSHSFLDGLSNFIKIRFERERSIEKRILKLIGKVEGVSEREAARQ